MTRYLCSFAIVLFLTPFLIADDSAIPQPPGNIAAGDPTPEEITAEKELNAYRISKGLSPLIFTREGRLACRACAEQQRGQLTHKAGWEYLSWGYNDVVEYERHTEKTATKRTGLFGLRTVKQVVKVGDPTSAKIKRDAGYEVIHRSWAKSPGHNRLMLHAAARVAGIGLHRQKNGNPVWCYRILEFHSADTLSPAMRNRFAWFEFQPTVKQWFSWARKQLDDEFNAFLFSAIEKGLEFSEDKEFMDDTQTLFCTPRSLWNCVEWSNRDVKAFLSNMGNFLPRKHGTYFRAVDKAVIKDRSNAIFTRLRAAIEEADTFDNILNTVDSTPDET